MNGSARSLRTASEAAIAQIEGWPRRLLIGLVRFYQLFFSAWVGSSCRFEPTCSHYALTALRQHGAMGGSYLAARRLLRCHPWCDGGHDPVPAHPWRRSRGGGLFSSLLSQTPGQLPEQQPASPSSDRLP